MNIGKFHCTFVKLILKIGVLTDEDSSPKLALSEGGSRGNIES